MRLLHEMAIFQTVKSKVIISLFDTVRLSGSISLRNLYNSLNSIKEIEDIYFFEVNTKYISSNVLKISIISGVRSTSEIADIFNIWDENIFGIYGKKSKFSFYFFTLKGKT